MIVTRQFDSARHNWSSNKLESFNDNTVLPRMSGDGSIVQPDWREQYPQYDSRTDNSEIGGQQDLNTRNIPHRSSAAQQQIQEVSGHTIERPGPAPSRNGGDQDVDRMRHDSLVSTHSVALSHSVAHSSNNSRTSSPTMHIDISPTNTSNRTEGEMNDEMDDAGEDYDDEENEDKPLSGNDKRKLKRFRLSHQQTRFLLAEFAKQNHPDAAHRDRLSREIPGLTSRQVQVWFQNRRAKMKRLGNEDRDRHLKMRQMPEHFDNVQALHSPYGALHSVGGAMVSPSDYNSGYSDQHSMRNLLVDTMRRHDVEDHMSPTGMTPAFQHMGFPTHTGLGGSDMLSPVAVNTANRYYSTQNSSPASDGPRTGHAFLRHNTSEDYSVHSQDRPAIRPLQPLQFRETLSRNRSESLQSPLRSSMSYKENSIDYANYPEDSTSSISGRQQSMYQPDGNASNYTSGTFNNTTSQTGYQSTHSPPSRFRSTTSAFPPNIDIRPTQYRNISSHPATAHPSMQPPNYTPTPRTAAFLPMTTSGFQSAPLNAPADFGAYTQSQSQHVQSHSGEQMLSPARNNTTQTQRDPRQGTTYHGQDDGSSVGLIGEHRRTSDEYEGASVGHATEADRRKYGGY